MKLTKAQANWTVELNVECPKCEHYFDALDTPDFWDGRKLEIGDSGPSAGVQRVDCPKCGQELTLELFY
jgi:ribosomal protein S27E